MKAASSNFGRLTILVAFKAAYLLLVTGIILFAPAGRDSELGRVDHIQWTAAGHPTYESYFTTWDAGHYLHLSEVGYRAGDEACAFYPLWPLLIRWFSALTRLDHIVSGVILANIFSIVGAFILQRIVAGRFGEVVGWWAVAIFFAFPGALFFQFIYSESLFFLLLMLLWFGLERNRFEVAFVSALLLPLTRAIGIFCVFPILFYLIKRLPKSIWSRLEKSGWSRWLVRFFHSGRSGNGDSTAPPVSQSKWIDWCLLAAPVGGWAVYFVLMSDWTGNPLEGFNAQSHWGVQSIRNLFNIPHFVLELFQPTVWHAFIGSALDRSVFIILIYCLPLIWRLDKGWFVWSIVLGIVPAMTGTFTSYTRFASIVFPFSIALAVCCSKPSRRYFLFLTLACFIAVHLVLLWRFLFFQWAG